MIIWPELGMGQYRDDDHQKDALHFTYSNWINEETFGCEHIPVTLFKTSEIVMTTYWGIK